MDWDAEPVFQSERHDLYQKHFDKLRDAGMVYPAFETMEELEGRPEARNLVAIYAALENRAPGDVLADHSGKGFGQFKPALADLTVAKLAPISERFNALKGDDAAIDAILAKGAAKASETGAPILASAYEALGLLR